MEGGGAQATVRVSIERLRVWLLVGAGALVVVLAGFLEYAHLASHRFLKNLPGKLGAEISREANGFTYSQSNGKRTLYTIHAAKFVQHKNSVVTLRDVGVVLYDTSGRADRIFGKEFEYDQAAGILRASGEVSLDLAVPAPNSAKERAAFAAGAPLGRTDETEAESAADPQAVHVRTRGVEFRQKEGVATTDQAVAFRYGEMEGRAVGADFRSDTGVTVLRSEVELRGVSHGRPMHLTANHAEFARETQELHLLHAEATGATAGGEQSVGSAAEATVLLRTASRPEEVRAAGSLLFRGRGATVRADRGTLRLSERDEPVSAELAGGVHYSADEAARHLEGEAAEAHSSFSPGGVLDRVHLAGGASTREREAAADRVLTATAMDLLFSQLPATRAAEHRVWLRQATATGAARLVAHQPVQAKGGRVQTDELAANALVAHLTPAGTREQLASIDGTGHTLVHRQDADGVELESSGDQLRASFTAAEGRGPGQTVETAEQVGHVHLEQRTAAAGKQSTATRGTADRATYTAATDLLTLQGAVQLMQPDGLLWADEVRLKQASGDATATGRVRASYRAATDGHAGSQPVEVQAMRAEMEHDAGQASFFGDHGHPARMWQNGSSVEAMVIEFDQNEQVLRAHGADAGSDAAAVRTVLAGSPQSSNELPGATHKSRPPQPVTRVSSRSLLYTDRTRQATFTGGTEVIQGDLRLRGDEATVFLQPAKSGAGTAGARPIAFPGSGSLDRIVTTGSIHVEEAGRQATGDRLVYTAADQTSVLTGSAGKPPVIIDPENGTLSGTEIRFTPGDHGENTVVVTGGGSSQPKLRKDARVR